MRVITVVCQCRALRSEYCVYDIIVRLLYYDNYSLNYKIHSFLFKHILRYGIVCKIET